MEEFGRRIDVLLQGLKELNRDLATARMFDNEELCQELVNQKNALLKEIDAENNKLLQSYGKSPVASLDRVASQQSWRGKLTKLKNNFTASVMKLNPKARASQRAEHTQDDNLGMNR